MAKTSMKIKQARPAKFSTRKYNRCKLCGRPHAYLRNYGVCRICFRELAYKGEILRKCAHCAMFGQPCVVPAEIVSLSYSQRLMRCLLHVSVQQIPEKLQKFL